MAVTDCSLDAEPESAGPAFGPCQNHLATTDGDPYQIDRRLGKGGRQMSVGHSSSSPLPQGFASATSNPSGQGNHPIDSISWKACGTESGTVRIMPRRLSYFRIGVCPMTRRGAGGFGSIHQFVPDG